MPPLSSIPPCPDPNPNPNPLTKKWAEVTGEIVRTLLSMPTFRGAITEILRNEMFFEQIFSLIIGNFLGHLIVYFSTVMKLNIIDYSRVVICSFPPVIVFEPRQIPASFYGAVGR